MFTRGFTHVWGQTMRVFNIRGMEFVMKTHRPPTFGSVRIERCAHGWPTDICGYRGPWRAIEKLDSILIDVRQNFILFHIFICRYHRNASWGNTRHRMLIGWLFIISHDSTAENYGYLNLRTTSPLQMMSWTSAWRRKSWSLGLAF
jgi:hypothetical protein